MPSTGCTTNVLTNGRVTCEPNCCRRLSSSNHRLRSPICSTRAHNLRRRCACHHDHHRAGSDINESDGEQCCLGQCAGRDATKHSEARTLCLLCGPTCPAARGLPHWHGVLLGSTRPVARYLGPHLDIMGSIRPELERRRAAAFRIWTGFRPVWFRAGVPLRVRRLFFQALVVSFLYTGLEALRLRPLITNTWTVSFLVSGAR